MFDVIIVGAGLSGLTTAYKILQKEPSLRLQILEADSRVGGQIGFVPSGEVGGKWILADQYHIFKLLTDLRVPMRRKTPISKDLERTWSIDNGFFAFAVKFELRRYIDDLNLRARLYRPESYNVTTEDKEVTMWSHIRGRLFFDSSRKFMMNFVRLVAGADPREICYLQFMNVIHGCGGTDILFSMFIEPTTSLIEFSSDHLLGALETRLDSVEIKRSTRVIEVHHQSDVVTVRSESGEYHTAKICVMAIPWNHICNIFITPPIPTTFELESPSSKCLLTSFIVEYEDAHWRRSGKSGNVYWSEPALYAQQYKPTSLCGYILHGDGFERSAPAFVLKRLTESFGKEMAQPVTYFQRTFEQTCLLNLPETSPWNRIVWSSSCSATNFRGCLSGAVQSGLRAAVQTLLILRPQNVTWRDLAEIQKASVVLQYPTVSELFKSSVNLYNTMFCAGMGLTVIFFFTLRSSGGEAAFFLEVASIEFEWNAP